MTRILSKSHVLAMLYSLRQVGFKIIEKELGYFTEAKDPNNERISLWYALKGKGNKYLVRHPDDFFRECK